MLSKWSESDRAFDAPTLSSYTALYIEAGIVLLPQQGAQLIITLFQELLANTTTQPWFCDRLALYLCKSSEVNYNYNNYFHCLHFNCTDAIGKLGKWFNFK